MNAKIPRGMMNHGGMPRGGGWTKILFSTTGGEVCSGCPQFGHPAAFTEISWPHSGQYNIISFTSIIRISRSSFSFGALQYICMLLQTQKKFEKFYFVRFLTEAERRSY